MVVGWVSLAVALRPHILYPHRHGVTPQQQQQHQQPSPLVGSLLLSSATNCLLSFFSQMTMSKTTNNNKDYKDMEEVQQQQHRPFLLPELALKELSQFGWTVIPQFWTNWRAVADDFWELRRLDQEQEQQHNDEYDDNDDKDKDVIDGDKEEETEEKQDFGQGRGRRRRRQRKYFVSADIGQDGLGHAAGASIITNTTQDINNKTFRDIRHSETCIIYPTMSSNNNNDMDHNIDKQQEEEGQCKTSTKPSPPLRPMSSSSSSLSFSSSLDVALPLPRNEAREQLLNGLQQVKKELQTSEILQCRDSVTASMALPLDHLWHEVSYAYYPVGGYYKRHVDAEPNELSSMRQYSFILYLNDDDSHDDSSYHDIPIVRNGDETMGDTTTRTTTTTQPWTATNGGGQLRLHRDSGHNVLPSNEWPNFVDVLPHGGTLVLFRSDWIPHEVLWTHHERGAVVGWFWRQDNRPTTMTTRTTATTTTTTVPKGISSCLRTIEPQTLQGLRALRREIPGLQTKLESLSNKSNTTSSSPNSFRFASGLLSDDEWGGRATSKTAMTTRTTTTTSMASSSSSSSSEFPDTDPRYWKSIATFNEQGRVVTLALAGQRLYKLSNSSILLDPALLFSSPSSLSISSSSFSSSSCCLTTLNLANTDLPLSLLEQVLETWVASTLSLASLTLQLYLGGNALGTTTTTAAKTMNGMPPSKGIDHGGKNDDDRNNNMNKNNETCSALERLVPHLLHNVTVLDLRYNDLQSSSNNNHKNNKNKAMMNANTNIRALSTLLHYGHVQKLYLEGNQLGNDGIQGMLSLLSTSTSSKQQMTRTMSSMPSLSRPMGGCQLRELYLGQNDIGPYGAQVLAQAILPPNDNEHDDEHDDQGVSVNVDDNDNKTDNNKADNNDVVMLSLPFLEKLYLEGNQLGNDGARALRHALVQQQQQAALLACRRRRGRRIQTKGVVPVSWLPLQKLYVENNGIDKHESIALGAALNSATTIGDGGFCQ